MAYKVRDIFNNEISRFSGAKDTENKLDQVAPLRTLKPFLVTGLGKWLAWKAST